MTDSTAEVGQRRRGVCHRYKTSEKGRAAHKRWYERMRADPVRYEKFLKRACEHQRKHRAEYKDSARTTNLLTLYGLTPHAYDEMMTRQGGQCAICGRAPKRLAVDHCHEDGHVRGLLCGSCNGGLGLLKDSLRIVDAAQRYLQERL